MAFIGTEEIYNGFNRKLYFTVTTPTADDKTQDAVWVELGYDDSFSFTENENEIQKYNKRDKSHKKRGRKEYTFEVGQLYAGIELSIFMMKQQEGTLKLETYGDDGELKEVSFFHKAYINSPSFNGGTDDGDDTISASGDYANRYLYKVAEGGTKTLAFATDGSHKA